MLIAAREIEDEIYPLKAGDLEIGKVYFDFAFVDHAMLIPMMDTLVLVDVSERNGKRHFLFQKAYTYFSGISFHDADLYEEIILCGYDEDALHTIYSFDQVVGEMLLCEGRNIAKR